MPIVDKYVDVMLDIKIYYCAAANYRIPFTTKVGLEVDHSLAVSMQSGFFPEFNDRRAIRVQCLWLTLTGRMPARGFAAGRSSLGRTSFV